jgi:hypothetical protein
VTANHLHPERRAIACPGVELRAGEAERGRREDVGHQNFVSQATDEISGGM